MVIEDLGDNDLSKIGAFLNHFDFCHHALILVIEYVAVKDELALDEG